MSDIDNLIKFVMDSLNGQAYLDDSQICSVSSKKFYCNAGEQPRTEVAIRYITDADK